MPTFDSRFSVAGSVGEVAAFHFQPGILKVLTPPLTLMQIHRLDPIADGSIAEFTIWMGPIPVYWKAEHSHVSESGFVDTQVAGPMKSWVHTHRFEAAGDGRAVVHDHIAFEHHTGWRGLRSRLLFHRLGLRFLFAARAHITRRHVKQIAKAAPTDLPAP